MINERQQQEGGSTSDIPIIDLEKYVKKESNTSQIAHAIRETCKNTGFFYIKNHGVPYQLQESLLANACKFFQLPKQEKQKIHMSKGGRAWRGYFSVGQQLTSGNIDIKEGIYLGQELPQTHEKVKANVPLHGRNLFPEQPAELKKNILEWLEHMDRLGGVLMEAIAQSLYLQKKFFSKDICKEHLGLLRIFHYPIDNYNNPKLWAVGEHTDYGLVTILLITDKGLQVKSRKDEWVKINPIQNTFVINIGDILQKMTRGLYKSTPHRAKNTQGVSRYSIPYFYDPGWDSQIKQLDLKVLQQEIEIIEKSRQFKRWDNIKLETISGSYGDYLKGKISKVFPQLAKQNLEKT